MSSDEAAAAPGAGGGAPGGAGAGGGGGGGSEGYRSDPYSFDSTALERAAKAAKVKDEPCWISWRDVYSHTLTVLVVGHQG